MQFRIISASLLAAMPLLALAPAIASADALSISCAGVPAATSITWTASTTGGVAPVALLWGNGATASSQTVNYAPGIQSMSLQATDASSTIAASTCSATIAWPKPIITSFTASPVSITAGQSSTLAWNVSGASSTAISGFSSLNGTATTVSPTVTTIYTLTAVNPGGTTTATATVFVSPTTTPPAGSIAAQIQALLAQIKALQAQILQLVTHVTPVSTSTPAVNGNPIRFCFESTRNLRLGDSGDDVRKLQQILASDPSLYPEGISSGFFGAKTQKALARFQKKFGLSTSTSGSLDTSTRAAFRQYCGNGIITSGTASSTITIGIPPGIFKKLDDVRGNSGRNGHDD